MKIGILGGTFDPIHNAHLFVAECARVQCGLDEVLFIPNGEPPHKDAGDVTPALQRLAMCELATAGNPCFVCSRLEIDRQGPSFAIDTLLSLRSGRPGADLLFITGTDALVEIRTWRRYREVLDACRFAVAVRPGASLDAVRDALPAEAARGLACIAMPEIGISATEIRARRRAGLPVRYLVPDPVDDYMDAHSLYLD